MMIITSETLKKWKACPDQLEKFTKLYPNGLEITKENCLLAAKTHYIHGGYTFTWAWYLALWVDRGGLSFEVYNKHRVFDKGLPNQPSAENAAQILWEGLVKKGWAGKG